MDTLNDVGQHSGPFIRLPDKLLIEQAGVSLFSVFGLWQFCFANFVDFLVLFWCSPCHGPFAALGFMSGLLVQVLSNIGEQKSTRMMKHGRVTEFEGFHKHGAPN